MRIAIVHDDLVRKGGAEQVALCFHKAFPEAPVYTLTYDAENTYPEFNRSAIKTSWFGKIIKSEKNMKRYYFPLGIMAMRQLDLSEYDVILQSTTHCAKYVKVSPAALVITYCHNPFRLVWSTESYEKVNNAGFLKKKLYEKVIDVLRRIDVEAANRTDWFVTNASAVVPRIKAAYNPVNAISVINPPVSIKNFYVAPVPGDYYLVVSRFESYKKVDLVIEAFNEMPERKLVIVGKGSREKEIKAKAAANIKFLNGLDAAQLAEVYAGCKAFIFPQLEDYGITPLEANASGRPVIAYGQGGVLDTMLPYTGRASTATALFFNEQTKEALKNAIAFSETLSFDPQFIRLHAETFEESHFIEKIRAFVRMKYRSHYSQGFRSAPEELKVMI